MFAQIALLYSRMSSRPVRLWRRFARSPWGSRAKVLVFAIAGALLAQALFGSVPAKVGPFDTTVAARPSTVGETVVHLPPLGEIQLDTHRGPVAVDLHVNQLTYDEAERIAENPEVIERLGDNAADEVAAALRRLAVRSLLLALVGGALGALAARAAWRNVFAGGGIGVVVVLAVLLGAVTSFDRNAVGEPRYSGLLAMAPRAVGDMESVLDRYGEYREQLSDLVSNAVSLYLAAEGLPTFEASDSTIRILHVSDLHLNDRGFDLMHNMVDQFQIDAIADTGDVTDWGTSAENTFVEEIGDFDVPYLWVRGNHDSMVTQDAVASQDNAIVLDDSAATVAGLRFWGIGDPRYTPDRQQAELGDHRKRAAAFAPEARERLEDDQPFAVDVVMVHDQRIAGELGGEVPLVLAGHTHKPEESRLAAEDGEGDAGASEGDASGEDDGDVGETETEPEPAPDEEEEEDEDEEGPEAEGESEGQDEGDGDGPAGEDETILMVEGSTGGAGLRGIQDEEPTPFTATVLYFDPETSRLAAYDRITVTGLGGTGATISRKVLSPTRDPESAAGAGLLVSGT